MYYLMQNGNLFSDIWEDASEENKITCIKILIDSNVKLGDTLKDTKRHLDQVPHSENIDELIEMAIWKAL